MFVPIVKWVVLGLTALLCSVGMAVAGQMVVLNSTKAGLVSGAIIDGEKPLELKQGERLQLVDQGGTVHDLFGPYNAVPSKGQAAGEDQGFLTALSSLTKGGGTETQALGAFRKAPSFGGPPPQAQAIMSQIVIQKSGVSCVKAALHPKLVLPVSPSAKPLHVILKGKGKSTAVEWKEGTVEHAWPEQMPLMDNARYTLELSEKVDGMDKMQVTVHLIPENMASIAHTAVWMADRKCMDQARRLIASLRQ